MQPGQEGTVFITGEHLAHLAAIIHRDIVVIGVDPESMGQETQIPQAGEVQGNLVAPFAVAVHVSVAEDAQHLGQLLHGGGGIQPRAAEPGRVDPHGIVELQLVNGGQRGNLT